MGHSSVRLFRKRARTVSSAPTFDSGLTPLSHSCSSSPTYSSGFWTLKLSGLLTVLKNLSWKIHQSVYYCIRVTTSMYEYTIYHKYVWIFLRLKLMACYDCYLKLTLPSPSKWKFEHWTYVTQTINSYALLSLLYEYMSNGHLYSRGIRDVAAREPSRSTTCATAWSCSRALKSFRSVHMCIYFRTVQRILVIACVTETWVVLASLVV